MVRVKEEIEDVKVRLFKWNEWPHSISIEGGGEEEESKGLFMFRIKIENQERNGFLKFPKLPPSESRPTLFDLAADLSMPESIEQLVSLAIKEEGSQILSQQTLFRLTKHISDHLLSCFRFDTTQTTKKPVLLVIVVDAYVSRTVYIAKRRFARKSFSISMTSSSSESKKRKFVEDHKGDKSRAKRECVELSARDDDDDVEEIRSKLWSLIEADGADGLLQQVEAAVKVGEVGGGAAAAADDDACSICLEGICENGMEVATTPCSHRFHRDCLFKWLPKTGHCPMCRFFCPTLV